MAEELYFIKLNVDKARTELVREFNSNSKFTYRDYLIKFTEEKLNYEKVVSKIEDNIEHLSLNEFWSIFLWFSKRVDFERLNLDLNKSIELFEKSMFDCGLDLFHEFTFKTPVRSFHSFLSDYEVLMRTDDMSPLLDYKSKSEAFNNFLHYAICYSGKLTVFINKEFYHQEDEEEKLLVQNEMDKIVLNGGSQYLDLALKQFTDKQEYYIETATLIQPMIEFRKSNAHVSSYPLPEMFNDLLNTEDSIVDEANAFYCLTELKEKMGNYSGTIVVLHSQ